MSDSRRFLSHISLLQVCREFPAAVAGRSRCLFAFEMKMGIAAGGCGDYGVLGRWDPSVEGGRGVWEKAGTCCRWLSFILTDRAATSFFSR